jgi:hypothetical protein
LRFRWHDGPAAHQGAHSNELSTTRRDNGSVAMKLCFWRTSYLTPFSRFAGCFGRFSM